ncbi:hypothetical protein L249_6861 [Ophiocordyceps polyrhachis-furcata BCC 54312]|uniref:NTF2 domain-containing protein n=1 Tax=Ophiocordyceps polyrhachis-furcata BCC 54312 TaxID=1330021 RepID=A0A367LKS5_9HYPO|nr:hypothetical protein L249_6861 [Ophiocordyceps polyrhachis-furcata BCC 54312]
MAPRSFRSSRESRDSPYRIRGMSGDGIAKRRALTRVDVDGDLDMDGTGKRLEKSVPTGPSGSRRPTRSVNYEGPRNSRGLSRRPQTAMRRQRGGLNSTNVRFPENTSRFRGKLMFLRVHGLKQSKAATNEDGGLGDLVNFLERKALAFTTGRPQRHVMIKKSHSAGDYVFIGASKEDAEEILKLNTFTFAGIQLEIVESDDGLQFESKATESEETQELRAKLQAILSQRYQGANKLLKLDNLANDPELVQLGMFENRERALKTFKGLMAICDGLFKTATEKREAIESISIANNGIDDISQVDSLAATFPQLKNLDMSDNAIKDMSALERWKGKFSQLETVYTSGNPLEVMEGNYQAMLLEWFPKLQIINGVQVRSAEQIEQLAAASRPQPIPQNGPDFRDVNGIGENFLLEFFAAYDKDRQGLASRFYDEDSKFSIAVDTRSVRDSKMPPAIPWSAYIKMSRNMTRITTVHGRIQRLFKGVSVIKDVWQGLPLTNHPDIKEDLSKYIMDCQPLLGLADPNGQRRTNVDGLIISVHGEFEELDRKSGERGRRSFSRTFVLGPGKAGNGPIRVVSDLLSLRKYNTLPNVFAAQCQTTTAPTANDQHQAMIAELSRQTGMVGEYCAMCLSQVDWHFDKAIAAFHERRAQLPAEAFAPAPQG